MNARDRLRRYLEQRREMGESELVLDSLSVDDVLRLVGAAGAGAGGAGAGGGRADAPAPNDGRPPAARVPDDVGAPADHPRLRGEGDPAVQDLPAVPAPPPPPPQPEEERPRPTAAVSEGAEDGDWRAALRAAGASAGGPPAPPSTSDQPTVPPRRTAQSQPPADATAGGESPMPGGVYPGTDIPLGVVYEGEGGLFGGPEAELATLDAIAETVRQCTRCPLYKTATHGVPGEGNPDADLVVVGEAPGADEDASGRPFVGASGQLLTKILAAINLARADVFICNVVKHRPPGNRNPAPEEVAACSPYLVRQLELVRPRVILTVGNFAAQTLLATKLGIGKLRGSVHLYRGVPLVATYHPAALLRNPAWKRPTWEDVQLVRRLLDRPADPG